MKPAELKKIIGEIMQRGPAGTTPPGAFLEHLSTLASRLDLTALPDFDYSEFMWWPASTPEWKARLSESFTSPGSLESAVASIRASVEAHRVRPTRE